MLHQLKRLVRDDDGMEFLECSIVGVVVVIAALHLWGKKAYFNAELEDFANRVTANRWYP